MIKSKKAKFSYSKIARQLGISEKELRKKLKKSKNDGNSLPAFAKRNKKQLGGIEEIPDFPDCSDYDKTDNTAILKDMIETYRIDRYSPEFQPKNESHYKAARQALCDKQSAYVQLQNIVIPLAKDIMKPTEQDFLNLEKCASEIKAEYDKTKPAGGKAGDEIKQNATSPNLFRRSLNQLKKIPKIIYILVIFFAALLSVFYYLGWLEPIKAFIKNLFWSE